MFYWKEVLLSKGLLLYWIGMLTLRGMLIGIGMLTLRDFRCVKKNTTRGKSLDIKRKTNPQWTLQDSELTVNQLIFSRSYFFFRKQL